MWQMYGLRDTIAESVRKQEEGRLQVVFNFQTQNIENEEILSLTLLRNIKWGNLFLKSHIQNYKYNFGEPSSKN